MGHFRTFGTFWDVWESFGTFKDIFWTFLVVLKCFGMFWDILGRFGTFWDTLGRFGTFWDVFGEQSPESGFIPKTKVPKLIVVFGDLVGATTNRMGREEGTASVNCASSGVPVI